ncbi:TIGR02253 family HAD-type hydrolase [Candidatus Woesearchaeota archaeon]|nr:TIGR02253 family HAD-type hydrolase [Candidatus Woesearchaeota archaeon]
MITSILFDLDNTLIDFWKMKKMTCDAAVSSMIDAGLKVDKEKALKELFAIFEKHGFEDSTVFQKFLIKKIGRVDYRILAHGVVAYRKVRIGFLEPYPHVVSTLLALKKKKLKLAIVTDAPKLKAWMRLASMKIGDYFDAVVTFEDTKKLKPSAMPFEAALRQLKANPRHCLMVGDWPERDIKGAKKLGMKTCFARYGNPNVRKSGADYEINDIQELLKIVK